MDLRDRGASAPDARRASGDHPIRRGSIRARGAALAYRRRMSIPARRTLVAALCSVVGTALACQGDPPPPMAASAERALAAAHGEMAPAIPILNVHDLRASEAYWRDVLGFRVEWEDGNPPDFAAVVRGDARFFFCQGCQGTPGGWAFVFVKDADALHDELKGRGARVRMPPADMPWGLRELHVTDPNGNVIRFAGPIRR